MFNHPLLSKPKPSLGLTRLSIRDCLSAKQTSVLVSRTEMASTSVLSLLRHYDHCRVQLAQALIESAVGHPARSPNEVVLTGLS